MDVTNEYKNIPYVKGSEGFPKTGWYPNPYPNRAKRRAHLQKSSRIGSRGRYMGVSLAKYGTGVVGYHHVPQPIVERDPVRFKVFVKKWISHYIPKTNIC